MTDPAAARLAAIRDVAANRPDLLSVNDIRALAADDIHAVAALIDRLTAELDSVRRAEAELRRLFDQRPGGALRTMLIDAGIITDTDRIGDTREKIRAYGAERDQARATARRLNYRCQQAESRLATFVRAVADWQINERGTYVPLRTLSAIAKAAGLEIEPGRFELHYQRVERAEAERDAARADAAQLRAERAALADDIVRYCPDHGDADTCRTTCHCDIAHEIRQGADQAKETEE